MGVSGGVVGVKTRHRTPARRPGRTFTPGNSVLAFSHPRRPAGEGIPMSRWWDRPGQLAGINLRSWLVIQLHESRGSLSVADLVERFAASGFVLDGRPSKVLSDALRWEVARGRVERLDRGTYRAGSIAKSSLARMRQRIASCLDHRTRAVEARSAAGVVMRLNGVSADSCVAAMRNQTDTPYPPDLDHRTPSPLCRPPP